MSSRSALRIFFLFSFLGWIIDSAYRSVLAGVLVWHGPTLPPFYPTYGLAALLMAWVIPRVARHPLGARIVAYAAVTSGWELVAGLFLTHVMGWRLWDYSASTVHLLGHIDLEHSTYWLLLALLSERSVYPLVERHIMKPRAQRRVEPLSSPAESGPQTTKAA